jgi:glycosyltransferase involved in cell wall biosynthesis
MSYDFGGGERVPVFIAREVANSSNLHPIIFSRSEKLLDFAKENAVTYKKTWWWSRQNWNGWRVTFTPIYTLWQVILFFYYLSLFIRYRPVVVHLQSKDDFIAGTFAARILGIKVLWSDYADLKHIFMNYKVWYKNPIGKMVYFAAHFTNKIIVVSKEDRRLISVHIPDGSIKNKMSVIYNGSFDSHAESRVKKNEKFTFVSSSRIVTDKGVGELIEAFNKFHKAHSNTELHILGDGPERNNFENIAKTNTAIKFLGYKPNPLDYVSRAHVFIIPTYHEGFSIALVEACMLGMPIIATDVGGNPEIIQDKKTGLLINTKDSDDLCKAMEELYINTKLRLAVGKNARAEYVKKFNFTTIIKQQFLPLYRGVK